MEYGNLLAELAARGFELQTDGDRVVSITSRSGEFLEEPTTEELLKLVTGMTVASIQAERPCQHGIQQPVFSESGEETNEYECAVCHKRFPRRIQE